MFAAIGLITASGAFTTVEAERTADIETAGDADALLALDAGNSELIDQQNGEATITLADGSDGDGLNINATTTVNGTDFLTVTNNGQDDVALNISAAGTNNASVYFVVDDNEYTSSESTFDGGSDLSDEITPSLINADEKTVIGGDADQTDVLLYSGNSISIGIVVDTRNTGELSANDEIIEGGSVTITADANSADEVTENDPTAQ